MIYEALLCLAQFCNARIMALPCLIDPRGLRVTQNAYFFLSTHTKKLLLATFCDTIAETEVSFRTHDARNHGHTDEQTDVTVEIFI